MLRIIEASGHQDQAPNKIDRQGRTATSAHRKNKAQQWPALPYDPLRPGRRWTRPRDQSARTALTAQLIKGGRTAMSRQRGPQLGGNIGCPRLVESSGVRLPCPTTPLSINRWRPPSSPRARVKRWPNAKITLRNGARVIEKTWPLVPLPK
jgi:hypothetical protein